MTNRIIIIVTILCSMLFTLNLGSRELKISNLSKSELAVKQKHDQASVLIYRDGLNALFKYISTRTDLFPQKRISKKRMLSLKDRQEVMGLWKSILDYYMALDSVDLFHRDFITAKGNRSKSFYISYSAMLTKYSFALKLLKLTDNDLTFDVIFNEPVPELGVLKGTYSAFKFRFLNVVKASQFASYETVKGIFRKPRDVKLLRLIEKDRAVIWNMAKGKGEELTVKNAFNIIKSLGAETAFPVQKGVSNWMGDTKVYRLHKYLITAKQIKNLTQKLQPGDILLERREWYLTNAGIPGYWTHAALYVGSKEERSRFFNRKDIARLLKKYKAKSINSLIGKSYPGAYSKSLVRTEKGYIPRVVEAISEGVSFTSIEYSAKCDSIAVLRPLVSKSDKALAVLRAFKYHGRPYDYNFDFLTDSALVCSELIYKAYEKGDGSRGVTFPLELIMGRYMMTPNLLAEEFAKLKKRKYRLITFIDGNEKKRRAVKSSEKSFLSTWKRPKWHIFIQK